MNKVFIFIAEGFEEIEAVTIIDVLRRAQIQVIIVSVTGNLFVKGAHQIELKADHLFKNNDYSSGEMIILPGGMPGTKNLDQHEGLKLEILDYRKADKYVAAICAAPMVLGNLEILNGKNAVCYPGFEKYLTGAILDTSPYIVDDKIITGRGVGAALLFSLEIVRIFKGEELANQLGKAMLVNDQYRH
jgi:4-methyl-5(b-hydroxyethyl)-thiazole monophosphate biosynthesis